MGDHPLSNDPVHSLREQFRHHLDTFYGTLKLAPPYHSVEKAVVELIRAVHALPPDQQQQLTADSAAQWREFKQAFIASGLHLKHRGILAGLARHRDGLSLPHEYHCFLDAVLEAGGR